MGSSCEQDSPPRLRMSTRFLWSNHCPWSSHCYSSGHNCDNQVCRTGRETEEGSRNSHFQLQPDLRSRPRRQRRTRAPEFFSSGRVSCYLVSHKLAKKGSSVKRTPRNSGEKAQNVQKKDEPQIDADLCRYIPVSETSAAFSADHHSPITSHCRLLTPLALGLLSLGSSK
jgi:hypothetical protein